jgi:hypothetical protein
MAKSFSTSALDIEKFSVAMAAAGPVAASAGVSLERTTALIGTLADRGLDASTAGTSLRNIFLDIAKAGLTFEEAMDQVRNATDQNTEALDLFGKRGATTAVILANNSEAAGKLEEALQNAGGAAQAMAEKQLDTLTGDLTKLTSAWEGFILSLENGEGVLGKLSRAFIQVTTDTVGFINEISKRPSDTFAILFEALIPANGEKAVNGRTALMALDKLKNKIGSLVDGSDVQGLSEYISMLEGMQGKVVEGGIAYNRLALEIEKARTAQSKLGQDLRSGGVAPQQENTTTGDPEAEDPQVAAVRNQVNTIKAIYQEAGVEISNLQQELADRELQTREGTLDALTRLDDDYYRRKAQQVQEDLQLAQTAANVGIGIIGNVAGAMGASAKFQQEMAMFQVILNQGLALSQAAASAKGITPIDYLLSLGAVVGAVTAQIAQSKNSIDGAGAPPAPPAFRTGTISSPEGPARVGESGEEMVFLPGGSRVLTAGETAGRSGNMFGPSFTGGDFSTGPAPAAIGGGGGNSEIGALIDRVDRWQREFKVVQVERDRQEFNQRRNDNRKYLGYRDN